MDAIKITDLFDLAHTRAGGMLAGKTYPWEALDEIRNTVLAIGASLDMGDITSPISYLWFNLLLHKPVWYRVGVKITFTKYKG